MIQASIRIAAPPDKRAEIIRVLRSLKGPTEVSRGCRYCRILQDVDDENVLTYLEQWDSQADFEQHHRSERCRRLLPLIDLSTTTPEVEFSTSSAVHGLEYLAVVLNSAMGE